MFHSAEGTGQPTGGQVVLSSEQVLLLIGIFAFTILAIGVLLSYRRKPLPSDSLTRSWVAVSFAASLILLCVVAFALGDVDTLKTLVGGLIASVSALGTFYFTARSAEKSQADILTAATGPAEPVPDLTDKTQAEAAQILGTTAFVLTVNPTSSPPGIDSRVAAQEPLPGTRAHRGTSVAVGFRQ